MVTESEVAPVVRFLAIPWTAASRLLILDFPEQVHRNRCHCSYSERQARGMESLSNCLCNCVTWDRSVYIFELLYNTCEPSGTVAGHACQQKYKAQDKIS